MDNKKTEIERMKASMLKRKAKRKPSFYVSIMPWSCIYMKAEAEFIAINIMKILKRTGDKFRDISWEEYMYERLQDADKDKGGGFRESEKKYFRLAMVYCVSDAQARKFSTSWA